MNEDRKALEELIIDNPDLERLETLLDEFNIFEVLGAVRVELRHSEFLAFLMNPSQSHGLGDYFVKKFLQKILVGVDPAGLPVSAIDLDIWSLDDLEVRREWYNIDILLLSEHHQLAVIIENKIWSGEHSNQLKRYYQIVKQHYPDWRILGIFLTPEGEEPSDNNFLPISYEVVCGLLEAVLETREASLGPDVYTLIDHYTTMLRRYIVSGSEIEELAQQIYKKHKKALDLIFEQRPDNQAAIREILETAISTTPGFALEPSSKNYVTFGLKDWDTPKLLEGQGWVESGRMLLFQFDNFPESLRLKLIVGPGPVETRRSIVEATSGHGSPFRNINTLGKNWNTIFIRNFLSKTDFEDGELSDLEAKFLSVWASFLEIDLLKIKGVIEEVILSLAE